MKSLIYTVFIVYVVATVLYFFGLPIVPRLKMMELLGVGIILIKFAIDYYKNRKTNPPYMKYAVYSFISFLIFNFALFTTQRIPLNISMSFFLLALLAFSMIGLNDSLKSLKNAREKKTMYTSYLYLAIFAVQGLYTLILAPTFLKNINLIILVPSILAFNILVILPIIIVKKAFNQHLLTGLLVISLSINTYLFIMIQNIGN